MSEVLLLGELTSTEEWNPLHFAVYYKDLPLVQYYLETLGVNPRLSLMGAMAQDIEQSLEGQSTWDITFPFPSITIQCFSLVLCFQHKDAALLNYMLNTYSQDGRYVAYPVWNTEVLDFLLKGCVSEHWLEGITTVLRGNCA